MKIKVFYNKSVHENAAYYYALAKEAKSKIHGAQEAIEQTQKEIAIASIPDKKEARIKRQKEWYEKFHFSFTNGGKLLFGGRNAQQNDQIVSKYMDENDLFFHADIQGGSVVILKDGKLADEQELLEAAQFASAFSKAWNNANAAVDVYSVTKNQLTKNVSGGFVPSGAFAIIGERRWFRNTKLALRIGLKDGKIMLVSDISKVHLEKELLLLPSKVGKEKGSMAKSLAKHFGLHPDDLLESLPNGKGRTKEVRN